MCKKSYFRYFFVWVLIVLGSSCWAGQRDISAAEVHAYSQQLTDKVRYTYVVTNKGTGKITGLEVGFDYYIGEPELLGNQPSHLANPPGWSSHITAMEESDSYSVAWETGSAAIQPGQMRAGFVIETSVPNPQLLSTHWTITADGPIVSASDVVVHVEGPAPGDTLSP